MTDEELAAVVRGIAPIVREQIAKAVSDLTPRVAVIEATLARLPAQEQTLGELRERVVSVETKAAAPPRHAPVDLAPLLERVAAAEARLHVLGDLRDRVVVMETNAAALVPATLEARPDPALGDLRYQLAGLEQTQGKDAIRLEGYTSDLERAAAALRERMAVVEARASIPGPPGKDGRDGTDGADGLGFDDCDVTFDGDKMLTVTFARAGVVKAFPFSLPFLRYMGVHQEGKQYGEGDVVTWAGSTWHCNAPTSTKPGDGSNGWTLIVKRGRDGKDGVDAPGALPVVAVGRPR